MNFSKQNVFYFLLLLFSIIAAINNFEIEKKNVLHVKLGEVYLENDGVHAKLSNIKTGNDLTFEFLDWTDFNDLTCYRQGVNKEEKVVIESLEVFAHGAKGFATFSSSLMDGVFWQKIETTVGQDASLFLKVELTDGKQYSAAIRESESNQPYISELLKSDFYHNTGIVLRQANLKREMDRESAIAVFDKNQIISPCYISNEFISKGLCKSLKLNTKQNDSLFVLVKTESGSIRKYEYANANMLILDDLLKEHVKATSIYFRIDDEKGNHSKNAILVISDDQSLQAVRPDLLENTLGISLDQVRFNKLEFETENLDFVWGDVQLRLAKNNAGDYFGKKRIGISQWKNNHLNSPNLVLGENLFMDSLSFDLSVATQDKDTVNKVVLKDLKTQLTGADFSIHLPDTLTTLPKGKQKKIIRLDGIKNESMGEANISLEIELYDDTPKRKKKKYQLHWGSIDTTLMQRIKNGKFSQSVELSLAKFLTTFKKEPVLTSSIKGVVNKFDYDLEHFRNGSLMASTRLSSDLKDASVFSNSIKMSTVPQEIKVGDKIILKAFSGPELVDNENLILDVLILDNSKEDNKLSIDDENLFLEWGDLKFKTTPLGDNSPKKRFQDQVVDKSNLQRIIHQQTILNKFGMKENIINAEWFINDDIYNTKKCEDKAWKECFISQLDGMHSGDFVSMFLRTSSGAGTICQFYIDEVSKESIIGFGNTQFDSLLFKYSKYTSTKLSKPQFAYEFNWGLSKVDLDLKGNPRVYGGGATISTAELKSMLSRPFEIMSSDGEVITVDHAYMYFTKIKRTETNKRFKGYDFDCKNKDCGLPKDEVARILEELEQGQAFSLRVFIDQHVPTEEHIKVSFIDFIIEDEGSAWVPKKLMPSRYDTDLFEFQFVYQDKEKTLVKLDQENEKYQWIVDKYKNDTSVELIDLPGFKTAHRAIYTKYDYGNDEAIRNTQVLSKNYTNGYTLYEYHDLESKNVNLYWKGYPSLIGAESYCKEDFVCAEGALELNVNKKELLILRGDLVILPESSAGYKFVFDDINTEEISSILSDLPSHTSLLFENLIVEGVDGKPLRFPRKFAFHIE